MVSPVTMFEEPENQEKGEKKNSCSLGTMVGLRILPPVFKILKFHLYSPEGILKQGSLTLELALLQRKRKFLKMSVLIQTHHEVCGVVIRKVCTTLECTKKDCLLESALNSPSKCKCILGNHFFFILLASHVLRQLSS